MVPYDTREEDILVVIEENALLVSIDNQPPAVKGKLHGKISIASSLWQLEPYTRPLMNRERTISTTSTISTSGSSYALVSDPEISSSFAASLETSDSEDFSPRALVSSMSNASFDGHTTSQRPPIRMTQLSRSISPRPPVTSVSSFSSSLESLNPWSSGRLLTLHLEKDPSSAYIWPCLIAGPAPHLLSVMDGDSIVHVQDETRLKYDLDPTSLVLCAQDLHNIRKDKEGAFEYFVRAWHQARPPQATMKLSTVFLPPHLVQNVNLDNLHPHENPVAYYMQAIGGREQLAQLYLEAGMLHLEGVALTMLSSSALGLSSIRLPDTRGRHGPTLGEWRKDREAARIYFERARLLHPDLEIPSLPDERETQFEMPSLDIGHIDQENTQSLEKHEEPVPKPRRKDELMLFDEDIDHSWYLHVPGLVGAGTAFLVVCALSIASWRRNQN
jgi:hypothetical protein